MSNEPRRGAAILLAALSLGGCSARSGDGQGKATAGQTVAFHRIRSAAGAFSVEMPAPVFERRVREGPMMAYVAHAVDEDGTRYEVARFDMPEPLDEPSRAEVLARAERGLESGGG